MVMLVYGKVMRQSKITIKSKITSTIISIHNPSEGVNVSDIPFLLV